MTKELFDYLSHITTAITAFGIGGLVGYIGYSLKRHRASPEELYEARNPANNSRLFAQIKRTDGGEAYVRVGEVSCGTGRRCVDLFYTGETNGTNIKPEYVFFVDSSREVGGIFAPLGGLEGEMGK